MKTATEIRAALRAGGCSVGSWMQLPDQSVAEIMGRAGYDWIAVDLEHGHFSNAMLPAMFRAIELGGTLPFARVADIDRAGIKAALDAGAQGLIFPMVESAGQLAAAISWSRYPPSGTRGVGYARTNLFGRNLDAGLRQAEELLLVAQIEHVRAVDAIEQILDVAGLDAIMIGPYDLSASMGLTGQFDHPLFVAALARIADAARRAGIPSGLHVVQPDPQRLADAVAGGHRFIAYGIDAVFLWSTAQAPAL